MLHDLRKTFLISFVISCVAIGLVRALTNFEGALLFAFAWMTAWIATGIVGVENTINKAQTGHEHADS